MDEFMGEETYELRFDIEDIELKTSFLIGEFREDRPGRSSVTFIGDIILDETDEHYETFNGHKIRLIFTSDRGTKNGHTYRWGALNKISVNTTRNPLLEFYGHVYTTYETVLFLSNISQWTEIGNPKYKQINLTIIKRDEPEDTHDPYVIIGAGVFTSNDGFNL